MSIGAMVPRSTFFSVVPERGLRQLERLLRHLQLTDRVDQVEVGVANGARGLGQRLPELQVGDFLVLETDGHVLPGAVEGEVSQQWLRVGGGQRRVDLRIEDAVGLLVVAREASMPNV